MSPFSSTFICLLALISSCSPAWRSFSSHGGFQEPNRTRPQHLQVLQSWRGRFLSPFPSERRQRTLLSPVTSAFLSRRFLR